MRFKVIISLIISVITLFNSMVFAEFEDISGTKYEKAAELLTSIGIMDAYVDGSFKPENTLTRAEFIAYAVKIMGLECFTGGVTEDVFADVPKDFWAAPEILLAYQMGLISGTGDNYFRPGEGVLYRDALRIAVNILGYPDIPGRTQLATAEGVGLTDRIDAGYDEVLTRGDAANLLYNCICADAVLYSMMLEGEAYKMNDREPLMSVTMGIEKEYGVIEASERLSLISPAPVLDTDEIVIDGILYNMKNPHFANLAGSRVEFYYTEDDDSERTLLYAREYKTKKLTIPAEDIADVEILKDMQIQISYWSSENKTGLKKVKVSKTADIAYNGAPKGTVTKEDLMPDEGSLTLIDNGDGYDKVIVYNCDVIAVDSFDTDGGEIFRKYSQMPYKLDEEAFDFFEITKDGKKITADEIKEWDILTIAISDNNEKCIVTVSDEMVVASVSSLTQEDEKEAYITLDETVYPVSAGLIAELGKLEVGSDIYAYISSFGKIAAFRIEPYTGIKYGYVIDARYIEEEEQKVRFKLFTADNTVEYFYASEKLRIDSNRVEIETQGALDAALGKINQLIIYKLNSQGEIASIDTAYTDKPKEGETEDSLHITYSTNAALNYRNVQKSIEGKAILDDNTLLFFVPKNIKNESDYYVGRVKTLKNGDNYAFTSYAVDTASGISSALVLDANKVTSDNAPLVVSKIVTALTEDEDIGYKISGISAGTEVTFTVAKSVENAELIKKGDIIRYQTDRTGNVNQIQRVLDADGGKLLVGGGSYANIMRALYGNAYDLKENKVLYFTEQKPDTSKLEDRELIDISKCSIVKVAKDAQTVEKGGASDIVTYKRKPGGYSRIFVYMRSAEPKMVVVYE